MMPQVPTSNFLQDTIRSAFEISPFLIFTYLYIQTGEFQIGLLALVSIFTYALKLNYYPRLRIVLQFKYPKLKEDAALEVGKKYFSLMMKDPFVKVIFTLFALLYISSLAEVIYFWNLQYAPLLMIYALSAILNFIAGFISLTFISCNYKEDIF